MRLNSPRSHRPHTSAGHADWQPRLAGHSEPAEPWRVVQRQRSGLLRYARARGTMALPVRYATSDRRIHLRLPHYNDAGQFLDRADVALDVHVSPGGGRRIVRVVGVGLAVPSDAVPEVIDAALEPWPEGLSTTAVVIVPEFVYWLPAVDDVRYPPLPDRFRRLPATFSG